MNVRRLGIAGLLVVGVTALGAGLTMAQGSSGGLSEDLGSDAFGGYEPPAATEGRGHVSTGTVEQAFTDRQAEILQDGMITSDEYHQVIADAVACGRALGLDIPDPMRGIDGVTLEFSIQHSSEEAIEAEWALFETQCYRELARDVDMRYQASPEVDIARAEARLVAESCGLPTLEAVLDPSVTIEVDMAAVEECVGDRTTRSVDVRVADE